MMLNLEKKSKIYAQYFKTKKHVDIYLISILDMFENLYNGFKDIPYHEKNVSFIKILKEEANNLNYSKLHLISSKKFNNNNRWYKL
ncbi:MAG: hypothetical protein L6U99_02410 [Clostridium sp.]|nr:MAG: hypothetical protein L6U99_02410 [Clostridium sp.]